MKLSVHDNITVLLFLNRNVLYCVQYRQLFSYSLYPIKQMIFSWRKSKEYTFITLYDLSKVD